jgi:glycine oxidase
VVFGDGGYLVPRGESTLVGSSEERAGFVREVTRPTAERLLARARRLCPALAEAEVESAWCGFRPKPQGGLPLIGPTAVAGLFLATGHYRNGILLAPITAEAVAAAVAGDRLPVDLQPFSGARLAIAPAR